MAKDKHVFMDEHRTEAMVNDEVKVGVVENYGGHFVSLFNTKYMEHVFLTMEEWEEVVKFVGKHRRDY